MALTLVSVVLVTRTFGILVDHSTESAKLLAPETVLLTLSLIAIRLESAGPRSAPNVRVPSFKALVE